MIKEINFSKKAVERINQLISEKPSGTFFRIAVKGGGCSGFQYEWGFVKNDEIAKSDEVMDFGKGKFVIDGMSVLYVAGTEINYVREVFGSHFEIKNPTAKSSCGCGESFSV